jgi:L-ascorbate metabolism protein UlaG (beta-lactamase superfamily)
MSDLPGLADGPIDVAVVPIAGWGPRLSEGHMDPEQAASACALSGARRALAVHWGTLHPPLVPRFTSEWMDRPAGEFEAALARVAPDCEPIRLLPGEVWEADARGAAGGGDDRRPPGPSPLA